MVFKAKKSSIRIHLLKTNTFLFLFHKKKNQPSFHVTEIHIFTVFATACMLLQKCWCIIVSNVSSN